MRFLLDSNAMIGLLNRSSAKLEARVRKHPASDIGISAIVAHELYYGADKSQRVAENLARLGLIRLETVSLDREDAVAAGRIRAALSKAGTPIGPYDVLIAGQALARGLTLVTNNVREFQRIEGLKLEDWSD
jgi:tRNA(fMet)-specific endonuclease VapC